MSTETKKRGDRKLRKGIVVSKSGAKTVKVAVSYRERHPLYGKVVTRTKNYHVHDEADTAKVGDVVAIMETRPLSATQIEACRVAINREMKRKGKLWIRVFPDKPVTRKPIEVRMGGGKGNPEFWAAVILPGKVLFEVGGVSEEVAKECLRLAATKIGIHTKFITRAGVKI